VSSGKLSRENGSVDFWWVWSDASSICLTLAAQNLGRTFLGLKSTSTDANGEVSFSKVLSEEVQAGQRITATVTGPGHNTSEFSGPRSVVQE
jgi:hypothetical protein